MKPAVVIGIFVGFIASCLLLLAQVADIQAEDEDTDSWCYAWIKQRDYDRVDSIDYPRVKFAIQNNGVEGYNGIRVQSDRFSSEQLICPAPMVGDETDPYNVTCTNYTRDLVANEYTEVSEAYSGESFFTGEVIRPYTLPSVIDDPHGNWSNSIELGSMDNTYATYYYDGVTTFPNNSNSVSGFVGFNVPLNATITGIDVQVKAYTTGAVTARNLYVALSKDGGATYQYNSAGNDLQWLSVPLFVGTVHEYSTNDGHLGFVNYDWQPQDFGTSNQITVDIYPGGNPRDFYVDYVIIRVRYEVLVAQRFNVGITDGSNTYWCDESALGTLYPDLSYAAGGSSSGYIRVDNTLVPLECAPGDLLCQLKTWLFNLAYSIFGIDTDYPILRYNDFMAYMNNRVPFAYVLAVTNNFDLLAPVGTSTPSAIPDFDLTWNPKWKVNDVMTDLDPVEIHIAGSTFQVAEDSRYMYYNFWKGILAVGFAFYCVSLFRRMFA